MAESKGTVNCDTCKEDSKGVNAVVLCRECRELYCSGCMSMHRAINSTKDHYLIKIADVNTDTKVKVVPPFCFVCDTTGKGQRSAEYLCKECRDLYCKSCKQHHIKLKATKNHHLSGVFGHDPNAQAESCKVDQSIPDESILVSSDFEGFGLSMNENALCAQFAVSTLKNKSDGDDRIGHLNKSVDQMTLSKENIDKISVKIINTFNAATASDGEKCHFKGIISIKNGQIVIADRFNSKLKLCDKNGEILYEARVSDTLSGITKMSDNSFAIVHTQTVSFYTVGNKTLQCDKQKSFKLNERGLGICFNGSTFVVIHRDRITVLSMEGVELRRISEKMPNLSWFVCSDPQTKDIYFTSVEKNILFCLSESGNHKWNSYTKLPRDICNFGNCLLTTTAGGEIILSTKDGSYHRSIFKNDKELEFAEYITFDPETQRLFVVRKSNSVVTVLKITH